MGPSSDLLLRQMLYPFGVPGMSFHFTALAYGCSFFLIFLLCPALCLFFSLQQVGWLVGWRVCSAQVYYGT